MPKPEIAWSEWNALEHHWVKGHTGDWGLEVAIPMRLYRQDKAGTVKAAKANIVRKLTL